MLLRFARWLAGIALHWFYGELRIVGGDRIPRDGPLLVAMNHRNALVDALLALWVVPRRVRITAKATIAANPAGALLVRAMGIVSLRRSVDEGATVDRTRNERAFAAIDHALRRGEAVLMFPEGRSHNEPGLAPLKTGLARAALAARARGVHGIHIAPIGVAFQDKAHPGTAVVMVVADGIDVDEWPDDEPHALTSELATRLNAATESGERALGDPPQRPGERRAGAAARVLARWGELTHRPALTLARRWALRRSGDLDEPAMYTMIFGFGLVLLTYVLVGAAAGLIAGPIAAVVAVAALVVGAHAAAYTPVTGS